MTTNITTPSDNTLPYSTTSVTSTNTTMRTMLIDDNRVNNQEILATPLEYSWAQKEQVEEQASEIRAGKRGALSQLDEVTTPTGTLVQTLDPKLVEVLSPIRNFKLDGRFKKLCTLTAQVQQRKNINRLTCMFVPTKLADLIDKYECYDDLNEDFITNSLVSIDSVDGFAFIDGFPFWERLSFEPVESFTLFKLYRDQKYYMLSSGELVTHNRAMGALSRDLDLDGRVISHMSKLYHWSDRCKAYDQFIRIKQLAYRKQQEAILKADHRHYARSLAASAYQRIVENVERFAPKDLLNLLELGLRYERISLDLPGDKPINATTDNQNIVAVFNQDNSNVATVNMNTSTVEQNFSQDIKDSNNLLSILHVLQQSGAMNTSLMQATKNDKLDVPVNTNTSNKADSVDYVDVEILDGDSSC